jgi:hypothetical protein
LSGAQPLVSTKLLFDPSDNIFISAISPNQFEAAPAVVGAVIDTIKQLCQN